MRQFLAVPLPAELRRELGQLAEGLSREVRGWRWVPEANLHLTLRFLGTMEAARDHAARELWRRAVAPSAPFAFRLNGFGHFPERGAPRVLWVGLEEWPSGSRLPVLAGRLEHAALEIGLAPERRPFRPHLTLARAPREGRCTAPRSCEFSSGTEGWVDRVVLFRSELSATGARYTALAEFPLEGLDTDRAQPVR